MTFETVFQEAIPACSDCQKVTTWEDWVAGAGEWEEVGDDGPRGMMRARASGKRGAEEPTTKCRGLETRRRGED